MSGEIVANGKPVGVMHRSASQFTSYMSCSEAYRLQRVAKAPQRPAAWTAMGSAFHNTVESWEKFWRIGTLEQADQVYQDEYDRLIQEAADNSLGEEWLTGSKKTGEQDIVERLAKGQEYVRKYITAALDQQNEWRIAQLEDGQPAVEVPFELTLGGVRVIGYIDCVREYADGHYEVIDYKTGSRRPDTPMQLALYVLAMQEMYGIEPAAGFLMAKDDPASWVHHEPVHSWTRGQFDRMFYAMDQMERSGFYVPQPGSHCRVCPVQRYCSIMGDPELAAQYQEGLDAPTATA